MRILRIGSKGDDVINLQSSLITLEYKPGATDGIFGVKTASAVIQFQKDNGLVPDGIVGSITWGNIQRLIATTGTYIIQPGDTFYKIALDNNITLAAIIAANPGVDPQMLRIGQAIQLYPVDSADPSIRITYPKDGATLPYSDVDITWNAFPGASGYTIVVTDIADQSNSYGYRVNVAADKHSFRLTKNHVISGHHYIIAVFSSVPDGSVYQSNLSRVSVTIGESAVKALTIKSPVQNANIVQGEQVFVLWDEPTDVSGTYNDISVTIENGVGNFTGQNGSAIPPDLLTLGKHHITVKLLSSLNYLNVLYQGSTDITIVPQ